MSNQRVRILATYLPQFHPIPENDAWWGKGFTEWTNVGKAKPLFKGHYQPRVPADLGYYDLRLPEVRQQQADLAREHGIEGFCYWHYWFGNGKRLLERPFNEVLASGRPDFPFCLSWANHSWQDKQFSKEGTERMLIEQLYPGVEDYLTHFYALLPAFQDKRYIRVDDKPIFQIYLPLKFPDVTTFIQCWQTEAKKNGLTGIHFVGHTLIEEDHQAILDKGFDAINIVRLYHFHKYKYSLPERAFMKMKRVWLKFGGIFDYEKLSPYFSSEKDKQENWYPTIIPNWDHSPRSGRRGNIFVNSNPQAFKKHVKQVLQTVKEKEPEHRIIFLKSWNEWAEGNYMEPDLKFGKGYLQALKEAVEEF
ncbi:MAG: glycoside hydrolase family 99-like domain-containing protein [Bacteroidetes bacterium]|nr:glycoside hydrolase family 99-like domain-containing protein [Bacteroidota bacterium]